MLVEVNLYECVSLCITGIDCPLNKDIPQGYISEQKTFEENPANKSEQDSTLTVIPNDNAQGTMNYPVVISDYLKMTHYNVLYITLYILLSVKIELS